MKLWNEICKAVHVKDGVFDPGENQVGLQIEGAGRSAVAMTKFFYEKLNAMGLNTHFVSADVDKNEAVVRKAKVFGKGVEKINIQIKKGDIGLPFYYKEIKWALSIK